MKKLFILTLFSLHLFVNGQENEAQQQKTLPLLAYQNYTSFGLLPGPSENYKTSPFSLIMDNNIRVTQYLSAGITTGIEFLNETVASLGINTKFMLPLENRTIYVGGYYGKLHSLEEPPPFYYYEDIHTHGGMLAGGEIGSIFPFSKGNSFFVAIGFRYSELHYDIESWGGTKSELDLYYNRLSVKLGIVLE